MKKTSEVKLSVLDLAPIREGKTIADTFRSALELARHVEQFGYERFWMAEHQTGRLRTHEIIASVHRS